MSISSSSIQSGVGQGAATGAAIGSIVPGVGTAIGAAVGALVGGISGAVGGRKARKIKRLKQAATAIQAQRDQNQVYAKFLNQIREARVARASSLAASVGAGIGTSSLASGATSSIGTQASRNMGVLATDYDLALKKQHLLAQAGEARQDLADFQSTMSMIGDLTKTAVQIGDDFQIFDQFKPDGGFGLQQTTKPVEVPTKPQQFGLVE